MNTSETENTQAQTPSIQRAYLWRKLFSLIGIVPLGIYVVLHLYNNMRSLSGPESFNAYMAQSHDRPLIVPIMVLIIWIPILFHGLYGLFIMKEARPNLGRFRYFENLKYILQRLSGIGLLLFIPAHLYKTRIEPTLAGTPVDFHHMVEGLHEPITLPVYLLGVLGVAYHLSNGLWQFCIGWGLTTSEQGMKRMQTFSMLMFIVLLAMGYAAMWGFYRAA